MKLQFDRQLQDYRSPKDLLEDVERQYEKPLEQAQACALILDDAEKGFMDSLDNFYKLAEGALKTDQQGVRKLGSQELRRALMQQAKSEIALLHKPIWYESPEPAGGYATFPMSDGCAESVERSLPSAEFVERQMEAISMWQSQAEQEWSDFEIARAVADHFQQSCDHRRASEGVLAAFASLRLAFEFRNEFRNRSKKKIAIVESLPSPAAVYNSNGPLVNCAVGHLMASTSHVGSAAGALEAKPDSQSYACNTGAFAGESPNDTYATEVGRKVIEGGIKGASIRRKGRERDRRMKKAIELYAIHKAERHRLPDTEVKKLVAREVGVSIKTIGRYLQEYSQWTNKDNKDK